MEFAVSAGISTSASTSGSGSRSDHASLRTSDSPATTVSFDSAQGDRPYVVRVNNLDPNATAEDLHVRSLRVQFLRSRSRVDHHQNHCFAFDIGLSRR